VSSAEHTVAAPSDDHRGRLVLWAAVIAAWTALAALGWVVGRDNRGAGPRTATTPGGVSFTVPKGYLLSGEQPEGILEALGVGEPESYGPNQNIAEGAVIVGQGHGQGSELLSARANANLHREEGPRLVRLGQDHIGVRSAGRMRVVERGRLVTAEVTVLAMPAAGAVAYVVCLPPPGSAAAPVVEACERLATTIGPPAGFGQPLTLGELNSHITSLEAVLRRYGRERARLRADLAHARSADARQSLAEELATLCARTGRSLSGRPYDPLAAPLQTRMLAALARCARAYMKLARAVASSDRPAYFQARGGIYAADTAMRQGLQLALAP
jgi:hypothetical protein